MFNEEEKKLIDNCKIWVQEEDIDYTRWFGLNELSVLVNLIEKQDKMIDKAINEIEILRQDFDESLQCDFIRILEILKDKKVIDW